MLCLNPWLGDLFRLHHSDASGAPMIPALAQLFTGSFARIGEALVLDDDPRAYVPGTELRDEARLRQLLAGFGKNYRAPDPLAVATQWSKWHFSLFLTPVIAANVAADRQLPVALDDVGIVLSSDSRTLAIRLAGQGERRHFAGAEERFSALIDEHLVPMIAALARASGLPAKVLWSNAGNVAESTVTHCAGLLGDTHVGVVQARSLFTVRLRPDGRRNELFMPASYDGDARRRRRICCLRYRMDELALCKTCPLDSIPKRKTHPGAAG